MKNNLIEAFEKKVIQKAKRHPDFRAGDTVRVMYKIQEGVDKSKSRLQPFEGVVIRKKKGTMDATFTVRKVGANGVGVERVFPLISPNIDSIKVLQEGRVRQSRLYHLRQLSGKAARIRSRFYSRREGSNVTVDVPEEAPQKGGEEAAAEENASS